MHTETNILIVEKDPIEIKRYISILGVQYKIDVSDATIEALSIVNNNKDSYSVIITALNMPEMDGYTYCMNLKKDLYTRSIPVIITGTSQEFSKKEVNTGFRSKEFDKLIKPFDPETLLNYVEINVQKKNLFQRLNLEAVLDEETQLHTPGYFKEALEFEILKANKLKIPFCTISITSNEPAASSNILSIIKNACRYYDIACFYGNKLLMLASNTNINEGKVILRRLNSVIYCLDMVIHSFSPNQTDIFEYKQKIFSEKH